MITRFIKDHALFAMNALLIAGLVGAGWLMRNQGQPIAPADTAVSSTDTATTTAVAPPTTATQAPSPASSSVTHSVTGGGENEGGEGSLDE